MVINKNANVTVIPARYHAVSQEKDEGKPKLRVAAYCRVSTDVEEQATSYEVQIEHYTEYIAIDHHGIAGTAGKPVLKLECEAWVAVPLPAGACAGQP